MKSAFSLIELLVVVAIIAILSAVSVPVYTDMVKRAKMAKVMAIADIYATTMQEKIENNEASYPIELHGYTWNAVTNITYTDHPELISNLLLLTSTHGDVGADELMLCINLSEDIGIVGGNGFTTPRFCQIVSLESGIYTRYCGNLDPDNGSNSVVPLEYLPPSCQCTEMRLPGRTCP